MGSRREMNTELQTQLKELHLPTIRALYEP